MTRSLDSTPTPDEEFDAFLTEINNQGELDFDVELFLLRVEANFQNELEKSGYLRLVEGNSRYEDELGRMVSDIRNTHHVNSEQAELVARNSLRQVSLNEDGIVKLIKATYVFNEYDILKGVANEDAFIARKSKLYTDLLVKYGIEQGSSLSNVVATLLRGGSIGPDDPRLDTYFMQSMEEQERAQKNRGKIDPLATEAMSFIDLDHAVESQLKFVEEKISIEHILVLAQNESNSQTVARRDKYMRLAARIFELSPAVAERLFQFINQKIPISQ